MDDLSQSRDRGLTPWRGRGGRGLWTPLEEARLDGLRARAGAAELRQDPPARRPLDEAALEQVRLVHVLDRVRLLAERDRAAVRRDLNDGLITPEAARDVYGLDSGAAK